MLNFYRKLLVYLLSKLSVRKHLFPLLSTIRTATIHAPCCYARKVGVMGSPTSVGVEAELFRFQSIGFIRVERLLFSLHFFAVLYLPLNFRSCRSVSAADGGLLCALTMPHLLSIIGSRP